MAFQHTYGFGSGIMWGVALNDINGNAIANPTPQRLGALQEMSLDIDMSSAELFGSNQFPLAVGRSKAKITGKCKFGEWNAGVLNSLYFGETAQPMVGGTTQIVIASDETSAIPGTPYEITAVNSATFVQDLGVRYNSGVNSGQYLKAVASAPTTGEYAVTSGVYTFAAADTGLSVKLDYTYAPTSSTNQSIQMENHIMGSIPIFKMFGQIRYASGNTYIQFNQCVANKLSLPTKLDGFAIGELDFEAFVDASGNLGILTLPNY